MTEKPRILFHVGYPKTASSWLQLHYFRKLPGSHYVGMDITNIEAKKRFASFINLIRRRLTPHTIIWPAYYRYLHEISFFDDAEFSIENYRDRLMADCRPNRLNIVSSEGMIRPWSFARTARRLGELSQWFDLKLLLSIRAQVDMICSRYFHDISLFTKSGIPMYTMNAALETAPEHCYHPACNFGMYECHCRKRGVKVIDLEQYDYLQLTQLYEEAVGPENVIFFVFENFVRDTAPTLINLNMQCLGVRLSDYASTIAKKKSENQRDPAFKKEVSAFNGPRWEETLARLHEHFAAGNRKLESARKLGLGELGYF